MAYHRVLKNKGSVGVDGIGRDRFKAHLQRRWPTIRARRLAQEYVPRPIRRMDIPKPQGGVRTLGIPTLTDRLIRQALHQVLSPLFEPGFSDASYGFRPGKSAHQAVGAPRQHAADGYRWAVDIKKFFDRVDHDLLIGKLAKQVGDARVLKLIRRYLTAGMMTDERLEARREGMPQGGPLSPLLSNVVLADLDRELERQGDPFCRFADDCNVYVRSKRAGQQLLASVTRFLAERLKLTVNESKNAVAHPWQRKFLGYGQTWHNKPRLRVAPTSRDRFKDKARQVLHGARGCSVCYTVKQLNPLLRGWAAYCRRTDAKGVLEELDGWIRRKLRCVLWRQWKRPYTRARTLMQVGLSEARVALRHQRAWPVVA